MCVDMHVHTYVYGDRHVHEYVSRCVWRKPHRHACVCVDVSIDGCKDMSIDMCADMCVDMSIDVWVQGEATKRCGEPAKPA